ncbi:porin [Paracoccaceae bacterium]|nr:porin [Paracoccaceae bacterium]
MKKILLTTSALTLLAGAAAADVNLSGYGRIGISTTGGASSQYTRMNLDFSGSSTTDGGVTLTAKTRYRTTGSATGLFSGPQASISNGAMSLTVGNAAGAVAQTAGVWGCGTVMWGCHDLTDDGWASNWATRSSGGAGPDVIRLDMALGGASVSVSGGNGNDAELAVSMPMGAGSVGIGYDNDNADTQKAITQVNYSGSVGDMGVGVKLAQQNAVTAYIASVSAPAGGGSVYIFAGKQLDTNNNYGLRYNQSLGGGASMHVGANNIAGTTTVGAGVHFGF